MPKAKAVFHYSQPNSQNAAASVRIPPGPTKGRIRVHLPFKPAPPPEHKGPRPGGR